MAIVRDLADDNGSVDVPYHTPNRSNAGDPNGSLTPAYYGEIVLDTSNTVRWKAVGITNSSWVAMDDWEVVA